MGWMDAWEGCLDAWMDGSIVRSVKGEQRMFVWYLHNAPNFLQGQDGYREDRPTPRPTPAVLPQSASIAVTCTTKDLKTHGGPYFYSNKT